MRSTSDAATQSCTPAAVGCREYRGTEAGNEREVIAERFDSNTTDNWDGATSTSNESTVNGGFSLQLHDSDTSNGDNAAISYNLFEQDSDGEIFGAVEAG